MPSLTLDPFLEMGMEEGYEKGNRSLYRFYGDGRRCNYSQQ